MKTRNQLRKQIGLFILLLIPAGIPAQNNLIPHIADCSVSRPPFQFDIQQAWVSSTASAISTCTTPLAGDIDGDGAVEIFAISTNQSDLYVLDGRDGRTITRLPVSGYVSGGVTSSIVLCNINGKGAIFNDGRYGTMSLYTVSSPAGVRPITFQQEWSVTGGNTSGDSGTMPIVVDFDGDGILEFVSKGQIIDSQDGSVLASLPYKSLSSAFNSSFHTAMDLDNDGLPEVVAGTEVYKYSRNAPEQLQLWKSLTTVATISMGEGISTAADVDQDGTVDLVFSGSGSSYYVWTPNTNTLIGTITGTSGYHSYPFVGDIDGVVTGGKKYPEICINATNILYAYSYTGMGFQQKWSMGHTDSSSSTSLTLFDFNLDGVVELVYRDQSHIRIFDGSGVTAVERAQFVCGSVTCDETPIIVDANGDGSADIVVTGAAGQAHPGEVRLFEGALSKWASCPPVWNQQMYSSLLVNRDLTIPASIEPVNLVFTQTCSDKLGNIVQFYNGGPMQAPSVSDETYCTIDLSPDVFIVSSDITVLSTTSVSITITVGNQGEAVASSNTPVRYYRNSISLSNVLTAANTTLGIDLPPGQTTTVTRTITGLSPMPAGFYVRLLDDGTNFPALGAFSDCDLTNNAAFLVDCALSTPVLNDIAGNSLCAGSLQPTITFSGNDVDAASCTWTNSNPNIGLAASGTGNIPAFTLSNTTGSSIMATITVTPVSAGGCTGAPKSFIIEVTPAVIPTITIQATPN